MKMYFHHNGRSDLGPRRRSKLAAPRIMSDNVSYDCPITGKPIDGRSAHRENLKRHDCRILEKGESRDQTKRVTEHFEGNMSLILNKALG